MADMIERLLRAHGPRRVGIEYYVAFSSWRLAVISEGVYARYANGVMADESADIEQFKIGVEHLAEAALAAARQLG